MTSTALKLIAVITMLIDHVGLAIFPQYAGMRIIGRLAFPLYCFLLTEGAVYTKNWLAYAGRLFLFALLAEVPFDLVLARTPVYSGYQNVFWTLAAGLMIVRLWYLYGCIRGKMYAIEKLVFEEKKLSFADFMDILKNNWDGEEALRQYVRNHYSYYGNDNDEVDKIAARIIHDFVEDCRQVECRNDVLRPPGISTFGRQIEWAPKRAATAFGLASAALCCSGSFPASSPFCPCSV